MRWIANHLRLSRRTTHPGVHAAGPDGPTLRLCRLSHIIVVLTNVLQLVFMLSFLTMLLLRLDDTIHVSWFCVFMSLWASDTITFLTGAQELYRLSRSVEVRCERITSLPQTSCGLSGAGRPALLSSAHRST